MARRISPGQPLQLRFVHQGIVAPAGQVDVLG
jgi:hypothetical protein